MKKCILLMLISVLLFGCGSKSNSDRRELKERITLLSFKESLPEGQLGGMQIEKIGPTGSEIVVLEDEDVCLASFEPFYNEVFATDYIPLDGTDNVYCYSMLVQNIAGKQRYYYGYNEEFMLDNDSFGLTVYDEEYINILEGIYNFYTDQLQIMINENESLTIYDYQGKGYTIQSEYGVTLNDNYSYNDIKDFDYQSYGLVLYENNQQIDEFPTEDGAHTILLKGDDITYQLVYQKS